MLRLGKITDIDKTTGMGMITDINEQEIEFSLLSIDLELSLSQDIWFNIELSNKGLIASNMMILFLIDLKENKNYNLFIYNNFFCHKGRFTI